MNGLFDNKIDVKNFKIFHFTIFTLFVYVFIRAGWGKIESKKNEGVKAHVVLSLHSLVPKMYADSNNDNDFLRQLKPLQGGIYVFNKGYASYNYYYNWTETGAFFVTKLNENASYEVLEQKSILERVSEIDVVLKDELISLKTDKRSLKVRLVIFKPYNW